MIVVEEKGVMQRERSDEPTVFLSHIQDCLRISQGVCIQGILWDLALGPGQLT